MYKLFLFFAFFLFQSGLAQRVEFLKIAKYRVSYLSDSLKENSGLNFFQGKLYTVNDGGNSSEIFEINPSSGKIKNTFKTNLINQDWEAVGSDSLHLYTADFGNNAGTRKDLKIYKIPFNGSVFSDSVKAVSYIYPEQNDFTGRVINNDFDAEAMILLHGKIHVFTKEWRSKSTTHYILNPENTGNQPAEKAEAFKTNFLITDAAYHREKLYLIGYTKNTEVFLTVFNETEPGIFFKEKPQKYYLGSALSIGQIEGIAVNENGVYISGEEFSTPLGTAKQAFYFIPMGKMK